MAKTMKVEDLQAQVEELKFEIIKKDALAAARNARIWVNEKETVWMPDSKSGVAGVSFYPLDNPDRPDDLARCVLLFQNFVWAQFKLRQKKDDLYLVSPYIMYGDKKDRKFLSLFGFSEDFYRSLVGDVIRAYTSKSDQAQGK